MRFAKLLPLMVLILFAARGAEALKQSTHQSVTADSCLAHGLPYGFCSSVGQVIYNVDSSEWDDMSAHAQISGSETSCRAANKSVQRVLELGQLARTALNQVAMDSQSTFVDTVPLHLGRALHTVQDNCAHAGMPNPQHAWYSLSDVCEDTNDSPDTQSAAYACARAETDAIFDAFVATLRQLGMDPGKMPGATQWRTFHPGYDQVCAFLHSANDWDGVDRRWDSHQVQPALRQGFLSGFADPLSSVFTPLCADVNDSLAISYTGADRDTTGGAQSCLKIQAFCLGKADGTNPAPPWETSEPPQATAGGCQMGGGTPSSALFVVGAALVLIARRRLREHV